jgi:hypothetical protein
MQRRYRLGTYRTKNMKENLSTPKPLIISVLELIGGVVNAEYQCFTQSPVYPFIYPYSLLPVPCVLGGDFSYCVRQSNLIIPTNEWRKGYRCRQQVCAGVCQDSPAALDGSRFGPSFLCRQELRHVETLAQEHSGTDPFVLTASIKEWLRSLKLSRLYATHILISFGARNDLYRP